MHREGLDYFAMDHVLLCIKSKLTINERWTKSDPAGYLTNWDGKKENKLSRQTPD